MAQSFSVPTSVLLLGLVWLIMKLARMGRRDKSLPPGPPTIPILGNIHLLPTKYPFLRFTEWAREYGGIMSLKVASGTIVVVTDFKVVKELMDDRSNETSSRPYLYAIEAVSGKNYFAFASSDSHVWRMGRKSILPYMAPQAVEEHLPIVEHETSQLLYDILHHPEDLCLHMSRFTLSIIAYVAFGKRIPRHDSPEANLFVEYIRQLTRSVSPEAAPVDLVPLLKYVPERWAPWKQLWRETRNLQRELYFSLLEYTEDRVKSGKRSGSFIETVIDKQVELGLTRDMVAYIGGNMLDAGTETASTLIQSLILCLIDSPESLRKAQEEMDSVIGSERLTSARDINSMPYIQAMIKEIHRLRPAVPTGLPHAAVNDCQYHGYTIPKGAPILINVWGIFHDPELFERPDDFWPERYLMTPDGTKPGLEKSFTLRSSLPFGSGKRLCPGMHLGNTNMNVAVMRLIWAFDFARTDGSVARTKKWNIANEYDDGITFSPKPFKCKITPRGQEKINMIEDYHKRFAHLD